MRRKILLSVSIFLASLILIGQNLDKPFWGEHDWNGVRYGTIARNYLRYGLISTKLGQLENGEYYTHYPPLHPLTIALSYKIFGITEWSTRLIPTLATAASIFLIFLIASRIYYFKIGILAALLATITPMSLYFGKNASHEPLALFFILVSFYGYVSIGKMKYSKLIFTIGLVLAQLTAWAGYFLVPALTIVHLLRKHTQEFKKLVPYWLLSFLLFGIHLLHVNILTGSISGGNLLESLLQRGGLLSAAQPPEFNLPNYFNQLRLWFSTLYTLTLVLLAGLGILNSWPVFSLGLVGVIYIIVFSNSVFIHNYLIFYFLPFLVISAALGIERLSQIKFFKRIHLLLIILAILAVFLERKSFLKALNESSQDKFAVEVGQAINENSKPEGLILVSPMKFSYSADKFLRFYSDRKIIYSDYEENYDIKVIVDQDNGKFEIIQKETR